jgi:hypothetical protein
VTPAAPQVSEAERILVNCYEQLADVTELHEHELAPFERTNAAKALAALWQVVNGLGLHPRPPTAAGS